MTVSLATWFARPALLAGLAVVPLLAVLFAWAWLRRRHAVAALGTPFAVRRLVLLRPGIRRWRASAVLMGVILLAIAAAGPQWGREPTETRSGDSDLAIVLDLSRSMTAEQPSRLEWAQRLLYRLADSLEERGGRRIALVVFAAEPRLLFPLTQDYDHFRHSLKQIADDDLPPLTGPPDAPLRSGTRFGSALRLAVESRDPAQGAGHAVLLLSDGDDPAADDEEWQEGVQAARAAGVRIFTVGIGDPEKPHTIPDAAGVLRYKDEVVRTRLDESLLQEIARRTGGEYLPAHTHAIPLGTLITTLLAQVPADSQGGADSLPVYQQRYGGFLAIGLGFLLLSLLMNEGPAVRRAGRRLAPVAAAGMAIFLVSASKLPDADPLVRQGNIAFAAGDFQAALRFYEEAERGATDPGLVAFNKGGALFRLGRFAEAANCFRQTLDDEQAPRDRRARAQYDLGTALVKQSEGRSALLLRRAVTAFRACVAQADLDADLRADARYNLELAQLLWLKAPADNPDQPDGTGDDHPPDRQPQKADGPRPAKNGKEGAGKGQLEQGKDGGDEANGAGQTGKKERVKAGPLLVLPDSDQVVPLPPAEAEAHLQQIIDRIIQERRAHWQSAAPPPKDVRNW